ncbi:hypothetical protein [Nocardioides sp.]|uniref:hypothetical protein n=1 Tax=Nocardioides sp. TaxID=35761 RepID=UPI00356ADF13
MAWAVPAISLATAAPALATSHGPDQLKITRFKARYIRKRRGVRVITGPIRNKGQSSAGQVTAVVTFPIRRKGPFRRPPKVSGRVSRGWSLVGRREGYNLTFVTNSEIEAGDRTQPLIFTVVTAGGKKRFSKGTVRLVVNGNDSSDTASSRL